MRHEAPGKTFDTTRSKERRLSQRNAGALRWPTCGTSFRAIALRERANLDTDRYVCEMVFAPSVALGTRQHANLEGSLQPLVVVGLLVPDIFCH